MKNHARRGLRLRSTIPAAVLALAALAPTPASAQATLSGDVAFIDLAPGGTQTLTLQAPALGNNLYLLLGSISGSTPGFSFAGFNIPLNMDGYFIISLLSPAPLLSNSFSALDTLGQGSAFFTLPAGSATGLAGITVTHAYAVFDPLQNAAVMAVSNPVDVLLVIGPPAGLVINEVDYDQPSTDSTEFIEIYNSGPVDVDLTNVVVDLINGNNSSSYNVLSLGTAAPSLPPGGYLVLGSAVVTAALPAGVAAFTFSVPNNNVQNGAPDGIVLMDTVLGVLDSMSYEGVMPGITEGTAGAPSDSNSILRSIVRLPDGADTNDNGADFTQSSTPTPGAANLP